MSIPFPSSVTAAPCHLPPGEGIVRVNLAFPLPGGRWPAGPDEGGYRWVRRPSNGRMGTSAPTPGCDRVRRGRCPQRPVDNGCTPVVPLIRHGLRPCHLLPCGAKALACIFGDAQMSMAFPSSVMGFAHATFPPGEGFFTMHNPLLFPADLEGDETPISSLLTPN